ncbi:retrovirus-related pol polyprotein from transposon TNT 1-94 [Tanacetum coccineum]
MPRTLIPLRAILGVLQIGIKSQGYREPDGPSYESAFISEVQSSSIDENNEPMDMKEMKDVFESTESELDELEKQNDFQEEIFEIQEGLQARIKILEKDVQRCEKQSVDFQHKLQHEKKNKKWDSNCEIKTTIPLDYSWISKMEKLEDENVSLDFKKTYAYGAIHDENQNLLSTISELKTRLEKVEKKTDVHKTEENHVVSKPVTLQTSPTKQTGANKNTHVIRPGMYRVVTTQELQTNKTKSALSSTGMNATSRVRRPMSRGSHIAHSVLDNSKKAAKNVAVYVRKNKQTGNTSADIIPNKENVIDVDVVNASKAKTLLCVSCMKNMLIPCHDKCVANHKLNVRLNVRRTFSTNSRPPKSSETTFVAPKTSASKAKDKVVQIFLWVVDNGCSKHMTGDRSLLRNFIEKFIGTVRFGNDNFVAITCYGDYIHGNITIFHVYYVEGLGHNLFSIGQCFDGDLEVAFRSNTCYVRNLQGDDLLTGGCDSNLYTISISDMAASSPVCLMSKPTSTKGKSKKASHLPKLVPSDHSKLELLHMDLCGPMRVASINGKKYILVIVDDYSRYTWVYFLRSKDETLEIIKKFIAQAQLNYKAKVCKIRTDNGTEFKNTSLKAHYEKLGIMQ